MLSKLFKNKFLAAVFIFSAFIVSAAAQDEEQQENSNNNEQSAETIWVGRGYDVMDKYASVDSVREALFKIRVGEDGKPVVVVGDETFPVTVDNNSNSTYDEFYGSSLSEYQTSFANNLSIGGRYKLFSASLDVNFEKNESNALAKEFLTIMHFVTTRRYAMPFDTKQMVKADAREFIDTGDPQEVFSRFGTHYIWQAEVGGRVDYNFTFTRTNANKDVSLRVAAKVAYNALVASVSVENETKYRTTLNQIEQNGKIKIVVYGGEESAAAKIRQSQNAFVDWAETVTSQPTLNRFTDRSLRPIWDLASTTERKNELKAAFDEYANSRELQESPPKVAVRRTNQLKMVGSNWYGRASEKHSVGIYAPVADPESGFFIAGHIADKNNNPDRPASLDTILVKDIAGAGKSLREPLGYTQVYNDRGTRARTDWSIWRVNCPVGFTALGYVGKAGHDAPNTDFPNQNPFRDVRCVHESLIERASALDNESQVYTGEGSGGQNLRVFTIKPDGDGISANFFYPDTNDYKSSPSNAPIFVLKNPDAANEEAEGEQ